MTYSSLTCTRQEWMERLNEEFENADPRWKEKYCNQDKFIRWIELILTLREEYELGRC